MAKLAAGKAVFLANRRGSEKIERPKHTAQVRKMNLQEGLLNLLVYFCQSVTLLLVYLYCALVYLLSLDKL